MTQAARHGLGVPGLAVEYEDRGAYLDNNPWAEPPEATVANGMAAVTAYFEDLHSSGVKTQRNTVKIVLVGQEGAGKTSLCRSMKNRRATPTDGSSESTVLADVESMELDGVSVRVYDCAGQVAYTGLLQMFLTRRAVCLLVCDAGVFGQQDSEADGQVEKDIRKLESLRVCSWLRSISQRIPGSDVILVATKCDLAGGNAAGIAQRMGVACQTWLERWVSAGMEPVRLEDGVCLTSCFATASNEHNDDLPRARSTPRRICAACRKWLASGVDEQEDVNSLSSRLEQAWECDWREDMAANPSPSMLHRIVNKKDGSGLRGATMVLPNSWDIALTVLEALENGRDPVGDVVKKCAETDKIIETNRAASVPELFKGIKTDELELKWEAAVAELSRMGINVTNADHALKGALSIREFDGTVVRHETFVFLDVVWLTRILKPLLNHKEQPTSDGKISLGDTGDTRIILEENTHIVSWNRLKKDGILEPELARILWPDLFSYVLPTLASLGLTFPLERDTAEDLVVLLSLGEKRPDTVGNDIETFCQKHSAILNVRWECFLGFPAGVIEKVLARCCGIGAVQTFWRFGVLVQGALSGSEGTGSFALVLESSSKLNSLDMKVYGDICTVAPWAALAYAISAVKTMATEFSGLRSRAFLGCPDHDQNMLITSKATHQGDKLLEGRGCRRCSPETGGVGAAAVELVRMVDVRKARGEVFDETNAKFIALQREYIALRPSRSRHLGSEEMFSDQLKAARESFLMDAKEDLDVLLRSWGASAAGEPRRQDGQHQDFETLRLTLEDIQGRLSEIERDVRGGLVATSRGQEASIAKMEELLAADDGVMGRLDCIVAMIMTMRADEVGTPRHACVLPGNYAEPHGLTEELRRPEVWKKKAEEWRESDFGAGKGIWKKKMRLFLICAHSHQLIPCGHDGRGYEIQRLRKWVRLTVDLGMFALQVACASLAAAAVGQLPATILGGVGEQVVEAASAVPPVTLEGMSLRDDDDEVVEVPRGEVQALKGDAYKNLRSFVRNMEVTARLEISAATTKAHKNRRPPPSTSEFVYFDQVMVKVQQRSGDSEAQWVLNEFEDAWYKAARAGSTG